MAAVRARLAAAFPTLVFTEPPAWPTTTTSWASSAPLPGASRCGHGDGPGRHPEHPADVGDRADAQIGILSAVGWQPGRILATIVAEGVLLAAVGFVAGSLVGLAAIHWLAGTPPVRGFIDPDVTPRLILEVGAGTLLLGILGSLYPAWRAVRLSAIDALRYE